MFPLLHLSVALAGATTLPDELPAGFALDGDLSEWTREPDLVLGAAQQLSGDNVETPEDFSARLWWTMQLDGLVFAAEVRDDVVLLPGRGEDPLFADHLSLWVELEPAELPPIGYEGDQGFVPVRGPADCAAQGDPEGCRAWLQAQPPRRARLSRLFIRQYTFTPAEIVETWSGLCVPAPVEEPSPAQAVCRSSQLALKLVEGGYRLEARIALTDLPATRDNPLTHLGLLVDAVDNDEGKIEQETTFSSSADADPNRASSFPRYDLRRPPLFDSDPPVFAAVGLGRSAPGLFWFPSLSLAAAYRLENLRLDGQRTPTLPSPAVTALDWSRPRHIATKGDIDIYEVPADGAGCAGCAVGRRVVVLRDDALVSELPLGAGAVRGFALRGERLHIVVTESGPGDPAVPGSAREHRVAALVVDDAGALQTLFQDSVVEGEPDDGHIYTEVTVQVTPDGSAFGFVGKRAPVDTPEQKAAFSRITQVDVSTGSYVAGEDAL